MKELIDKSAVVAEIKKLRERAYELYGCSQFGTAYNNVLESIDTLETKTVDLEKEIDDYWCSLFCDYKMKRVAGHKFVPVPEYIDENFNQCENGKTQIAYVLEVDWKTDFNDNEWNGDDVMKFAQYFYELGLKTKNGEEV